MELNTTKVIDSSEQNLYTLRQVGCNRAGEQSRFLNQHILEERRTKNGRINQRRPPEEEGQEESRSQESRKEGRKEEITAKPESPAIPLVKTAKVNT